MDLSVWIVKPIYGLTQQIGYTTAKDAIGWTEI